MKRLTIGIAALACVLVGGALSYAALPPRLTSEPFIDGYYDDINNGRRVEAANRLCADEQASLALVDEYIAAVQSAGQPLSYEVMQSTNLEQAFVPLGSLSGAVYHYYGVVTLPDGTTRRDRINVRCTLRDCCIESVQQEKP
ncbi:MAG: hypothetical protein GX552_01945 [Chloroflexi bacterium]|jgi:hypothetical protein|nr:hypothetical protein [Chloroflexota bacterium]